VDQLESLEGLRPALKGVAADLAVAFDTTLVALLMSFVALLVQTLIRQQESRLLADVEDYLTYRLQSRIGSETEDVRVENVLRTSLSELNQLQERIHEEARDRARVTMQTIMTAQQNIQDALGQMPELITNAANASATMLDETRLKLQTIGDTAASRMAEAVGVAAERTGRELVGMRDQVLQGVSQQVETLLAESAKRFAGAVTPLQQSIDRVAQHLGRVFQDSERLLMMQTSLHDSMKQFAQVQNMAQTFEELRVALTALRPALEKLSRPVPLRLSLAGAQAPGRA
jgi:hypothetical protein